MNNLNETAHKILDAAEIFTQTRGFNDFSYKDLQTEVGVKTSSIHYYFPTKQDLGTALIERYTDKFLDTLMEISHKHKSAEAKLNALYELYKNTSSQGMVCLCGILASESLSLPPQGHVGLSRFFKESERWITQVIKQGSEEKEFSADINAETNAATMLASLQGALIIAKTKNDNGYISVIAQEALKNLKNN